jgi:hypothetical protein
MKWYLKSGQFMVIFSVMSIGMYVFARSRKAFYGIKYNFAVAFVMLFLLVTDWLIFVAVYGILADHIPHLAAPYL